jgi:hypothetical protein
MQGRSSSGCGAALRLACPGSSRASRVQVTTARSCHQQLVSAALDNDTCLHQQLKRQSQSIIASCILQHVQSRPPSWSARQLPAAAAAQRRLWTTTTAAATSPAITSARHADGRLRRQATRLPAPGWTAPHASARACTGRCACKTVEAGQEPWWQCIRLWQSVRAYIHIQSEACAN